MLCWHWADSGDQGKVNLPLSGAHLSVGETPNALPGHNEWFHLSCCGSPAGEGEKAARSRADPRLKAGGGCLP